MSRRLLYLLVPLCVIFACFAQIRMRTSVPSRADWQAATTAIRDALQPGDGVTWTPYYAGEGRLFFQGLPAFHTESLDNADFSSYKRVWLLGAFSENADALLDTHRLIERKTFGKLTLDLLEVKGEKTVASLRQHLENIAVSYGKDHEICSFWNGRGWACKLSQSPELTRACLDAPIDDRLRDFRRHRSTACGLDEQLQANRDVRIIADFPRRCVFLNPQKDGVIRFDWFDAPAGEWVLDVGFTDAVTVSRSKKQLVRRKPVQVKIARGGERQTLTIPPVKAWQRWRGGHSGTGALAMEWMTDENEAAEVCFELTLRTER